MTTRLHRPTDRFAATLAAVAVSVCVVARAGGAVPVSAPGPVPGAGPHVVLDVAGGRLRLLFDGAVLRDYPVRAIEAGRPTVLTVPRTVRASPDGDVRTLRAIDPARPTERPVVLAPEPGEEPLPAAPPPSPEEA